MNLESENKMLIVYWICLKCISLFINLSPTLYFSRTPLCNFGRCVYTMCMNESDFWFDGLTHLAQMTSNDKHIIICRCKDQKQRIKYVSLMSRLRPSNVTKIHPKYLSTRKHTSSFTHIEGITRFDFWLDFSSSSQNYIVTYVIIPIRTCLKLVLDFK